MSKSAFSKLIAIHQVQVLATTFSRLMTEQLGNNLAEVNRRNAAQTDKSICHSHDFLDANMVMLDAFEELGVEMDLQNEKQTSVINAAWNIAKAAKFSVNLDGLTSSIMKTASL